MSAITRRGMIGAGAMLALPHPAKAQNAELQFSGAIRIDRQSL